MTSDPFVGKTFGKCLLKKQIGKGAIGVVYRAYHLTLNIHVAVKILKPQTSFFSESAAQRFQREARAAGFLEHRNVLKIFDVGEQDDVHFIVMECIDGKAVEDFLNKQGPLPIKKSIKIIKQAADGLSAAHEANILHRDVKPANIMIQKKDELVKLADFGLARLDFDNEVKLTDTGSIIGTMGYSSPEQTKGNPTYLSDIYSLGVTFFEMLTGQLPYQGESPYVVMNHHAKSSIPSARSLRSEIPSTVDLFIQKMMAKKPEERPKSAAYISQFLEEYLQKVRRTIESRPTERNNSVASLLPPASPKRTTKEMPMVKKQKSSAYHTRVRTTSNLEVDKAIPKKITESIKKQNFSESSEFVKKQSMLENVSGTFEYQIPDKTVNKIWSVIVTVLLLSVASLTTLLAILTYYHE